VPIPPPISAVNGLTSRLFNALYYPLYPVGESRPHYEPYFYPLDGIGQWNRMYGPRGFYQYQCVVPSEDATIELVAAVADARSASFLNVLKALGARAPQGLLSFPRPGYTLALDFPNRGPDTLRLFERLDAIVSAAGGAIYPAKDARMPGKLFRESYPKWQEVEQLRDPQFSSNFWRRVTRE
jgi:FAD/FMN-containing dehydrogenase